MSSPLGAVEIESAVPAVEPLAFRRVMGHFLTGVAVVSTLDGEQPVGLTVGSFFSVSLDPPLVGFCAAHTSKSWPVIKRTGRFSVNVLAADQEAVCRSFASTGTDKFDGIDWIRSDGGCPILKDALAWMDCTIEVIHVAGDHEICIGRVATLGDVRSWPPLPFFRGRHELP